MPIKIETEPAVYPVIRFINVDLNTSVSRFAKKWNRKPSTINNWAGRGEERKNIKIMSQLPIWIVQIFATETNSTMDSVYEKLCEYYADWEPDNRHYLLRDGTIKPTSVQDYVALKLGKPYHVEVSEDYGLNSVDGLFDNFIVEVNRSMDGFNEDSIYVYQNNTEHKLLFKFTDDDFELNDEEEIADKIIAKLG